MSVLKWTLGIAAGAVIGAVAVRTFDRYLWPKLEGKKKDQLSEVEENPSHPLSGAIGNPVYAQLLAPTLPSIQPFHVGPPMGMYPPMAQYMPSYAALPQFRPRRRQPAVVEVVDPEEEENQEILREYLELDS